MTRTRTAVVLAAALLATVAIDAHAAAPPPVPPAATVGPLISGTSSYVDGTYVWTDYAYDDRGPDTNGIAGGDATYPTTAAPGNVADLVQLQLSLAGPDRLAVTAVLETLTDTSRPVIGLALDSDGVAATGAPSLPGSWHTAGLGVDRLLLLGRDGGRELRWDGGAWTPAGRFDVRLDSTANTVRAVVPFTTPQSGRLRAVAAAGYDDGAGGSWVTGASPVHDLAFVVDDVPTVSQVQSVTDAVSGFATGGERQWQDDHQSAILAGHGDAAPAVANVDVRAMQQRRTVLADASAKGFHTFLYRSPLRLGEGIHPVTTHGMTSNFYAGPYQPYRVWVPGARPGVTDPYRGLPLVLYLHGSSQTHLSAVNTQPYDEGGPFADLPAVVAWPLGRGPETWYEGAALVDPLDVERDVVGRLSLDPERVMLAGLSMGGYGTFKLGELFPDRWSLAYVDAAADETELPENLTALPIRVQNGGADPLIPVGELADGHLPPPLGIRAGLDGAGSVDYRSYFIAKETHQPAVELAECLYRSSFAHPKVRNPARVRYTVDPSLFVDDAASGLRLRWDGAYWVSGMTPAGTAKGSVDLTTFAFGSVPVAGPTFSATYENVTAGRDFCGPNPAVRTQDVWTEQGRSVGRRSVPAERRLVGSVRGLSAVTVAADRALPGRGPVSLDVTADRDVVLRLTGLGPTPRAVRLHAGRNVVQVVRG